MFHNNKFFPLKIGILKNSNVSALELLQAQWQRQPHVANHFHNENCVSFFSFLSLTSQYKALIAHVSDFLALTFGLNYSHSADVQCRIRTQYKEGSYNISQLQDFSSRHYKTETKKMTTSSFQPNG